MSSTQAGPADELAVGKRNHVRVRGVYHLVCTRPAADRYSVELSWPTMARNCGCDFAGRAHAHHAITVATMDAARALYAQAKGLLLTTQANVVSRTIGLSNADLVDGK